MSHYEGLKNTAASGGKLYEPAKVGKNSFNLAWGHGGQFIILLHDLNMIIVVTSDPFYGKEKHFDGWQYEKSNINLVGKFIQLLNY